MCVAMNYRHGFHAGNFADVLKHIILSRIVLYLGRKAQPFRVIDTHAGAGLYDLTSEDALRTGEWRDGIGRLFETTLQAECEDIIAPYRQALARFSRAEGGTPRFYPGSPLIAAALMRPMDTLIANDRLDEEAAILRQSLKAHVGRTGPDWKVTERDGWETLKAMLPPRERRGLVVIDPPFEQKDEFASIRDGLAEARRRFANGVYLIWYPVKDRAAVNHVIGRLIADMAAPDLTDAGVTTGPGIAVPARPAGQRPTTYLDVRLAVSDPFPGLGLTETGVLVVNPPYTLEAELRMLMPELSALLADGKGAGFALQGSPV